jgi:hypothetical protein
MNADSFHEGISKSAIVLPLTIKPKSVTIEIAWQAVPYSTGLPQSSGAMTRGFCFYEALLF